MGLFLLVLFGAVFGFHLYQAVRNGKAMANYLPPPVSVSAAHITATEIPHALDAIGSLESVHQVTISPEVDGRITRLHFAPGSVVKAGQPLIQLNDAPEQGDLQRFRAQEKLARINLERSTKLLNLAVSQSEVDAQQAAVEDFGGQIARTQALIAQKEIRAPFNGVLGVQRVHLGQFVKQGEPLVTLTDLKTLYLNFTLPEQDHALVKPGLAVKFSVDAAPGREFNAKIVAVEPQIGADSRAIKIQALLDNSQLLLTPGMFARAALQLEPEKNVLLIPATAIDFSIHGDSVFILEKRKSARGEVLTAVRTLVKIDGQIGDKVIVRSGLKSGDLVVTAGQIKLQDGAPVEIAQGDALGNIAAKVSSRPE